MKKLTIELTNEDHVKQLCEELGIDHIEFTTFIKQLILKRGANTTWQSITQQQR